MTIGSLVNFHLILFLLVFYLSYACFVMLEFPFAIYILYKQLTL